MSTEQQGREKKTQRTLILEALIRIHTLTGREALEALGWKFAQDDEGVIYHHSSWMLWHPYGPEALDPTRSVEEGTAIANALGYDVKWIDHFKVEVISADFEVKRAIMRNSGSREKSLLSALLMAELKMAI